MILTTLAAMCFVASTRADYQFTGTQSHWQRVAHCISAVDGSFENGLDYSRMEIASMAHRATQVKICTGGSTTDCVTSRANSYPVVNLREGITMLSHIDGTTPCTAGCVRRFWEGPDLRLFQLRASDVATSSQCAPGYLRFNTSMVWWACGTGGLHFTLVPGQRQCFWGATQQNDNIEVFIDSDYTTAPTGSPTAAPSNWNQHPGHLTNWTVAQARITALEQTVARLEAERPSYVTTVAMALALTDERVEAAAAVATVRTDAYDRIDAVNATLTTLRAALRSAVAAAASNPASSSEPPSVDAEGSDLTLRSPGGVVKVESSACSAFDLCDLNTFQERLADALLAV